MKCPKCRTNNPAHSQFCKKCGTSFIENSSIPNPQPRKKHAKKSPLHFAPGEYFGERYKIIKQLSRGSMGRIYKALDTRQNKIVALRIFNPELSHSAWTDIVQELQAKKMREKEKAPQSGDRAHEKVTKLYDIGTVGKIKFISMQYVEQESLKPAKKLIISLSTALIVLIGLVIFFAVIKSKPEPPPLTGPGKKSIAVMYFENNTGDESLDHWRKALSDLLITDLTQSRYIRVLSEDKLFKILGQLNQLEAKEYPLEVLQQVAKRGKVGYILLGSYSKAGNRFRINIKIQEARTGELIDSEIMEAIGEENIFAMVDDLTKRIKATFEFSEELIASDIDKEVGKITTSSPEAYKYYVEGRKYHNKADYRKAIQLMEKAIAVDPEFAMAYRSMAKTYGNMFYEAEHNKYIQKALELAERVSDRERYQIQADAYKQSEKTLDKAIAAYKKLLQLYPDETIVNNNLGTVFMELEQWDEAIERFEVCIQNKDEDIFPYTNQAGSYMYKGLYNKAKGVLEHYISNFSDNAGILRMLADNYLCQGKYDLAFDKMHKAISLNPDYYINPEYIGDICLLRGDMLEAEKEYQKLLKSEEPMAHLEGSNRLGALYLLPGRFEQSKNYYNQGIEQAKKIGDKEWEEGFHSFLAYLYLTSGSQEKALEECNKAWGGAVETDFLALQRYTLHYKGLSYLEINSMDEAVKTAEELKKLLEKGLNKKVIRYYHHLKGMIELKRKNFSQAIESFEKALSLLPSQNPDSWVLHNRHALFIDSLAMAYYCSGDLEKAQKEYEKITSLTMGRLFYGDIYAKSYYMLGKIYQQKEWKGKAIENYEKFLILWKDADPGIPELEDAKKQLAALQSN